MIPHWPEDAELEHELLAVGEGLFQLFRRAFQAYEDAGVDNPKMHALDAIEAYVQALRDAAKLAAAQANGLPCEAPWSVDGLPGSRTRGH